MNNHPNNSHGVDRKHIAITSRTFSIAARHYIVLEDGTWRYHCVPNTEKRISEKFLFNEQILIRTL